MSSNLRISFIANLLVILAGMGATQQKPPLLQISSPGDDAIVNPGQAVNVVVDSPAGASFTNVGVVGEAPIGFGGIASAVPARLSITIPSDIACRRYMLTAHGLTASGESVESAAIDLDVERPDKPVSLSNQMEQLIMETQGETSQLLLLAKFSDGMILDVSESSRITFQSMDTAVATVDNRGAVTAAGAGTGSVVVTYHTPNASVLRYSIQVTVLPPALTVVPGKLVFGGGAAVTVGAEARARITVTNTTASDGSLHIKSVVASRDFSETNDCIRPSPFPIGGTCTINVTFAPTEQGERKGELTIINSANSVPIVISLHGVAVLTGR
jgi:hypothetical protein